MELNAVLFDLGGVVLEWEPERAFEHVMDASEILAFMDRVGFAAWNHAQDAGRSWAEAETTLIARFPADADAILAYRRHFEATLTGTVPGTPAILDELAAADVPIAALTNWSAETFPVARDKFEILDRFATIVVSGEEQLAKPDPAIFVLACERAGFTPSRTVFVDDSPGNVEAAETVGLTGLVFTDADRLRADLVRLGLVPYSA
nr:HAD family phosphatase [Propionicimonas sp.]